MNNVLNTTARAFSLVGLLVAAVAVAIGGPVPGRAAAPVAAAACSPGLITDPVAVSVTKADGTSGPFAAWERTRVSFDIANLASGDCSGDSLTVTLPAELHLPDATYPIFATTDPTAQVATMTVVGGVLTVTLNDYFETHTQGRSLHFWVEAQLDATIAPDSRSTLDFEVNGTTTTTVDVVTTPCPECNAMPTWAGKWGSAEAGYVVIQTPVIAAAGTVVTWTDILRDGFQNFDCTVPVALDGYTERTAWGDSADRESISGNAEFAADVASADDPMRCDPAKLGEPKTVTGTATTTRANQVLQVRVAMTFDASRGAGSWSDEATVAYDQVEVGGVTATVRSFNGGGGGAGTKVEYNLTLAKQRTSAATVAPGGTVTYSLTPHNEGPSTALAGWSVTEVLPAGLSLVSMSGDDYTCAALTCTAAEPLGPGTYGSAITVTAKVDAAFTGSSLRNVAYVSPSADDQPETNPLGEPPAAGTDTSATTTDNDAHADVDVVPAATTTTTEPTTSTSTSESTTTSSTVPPDVTFPGTSAPAVSVPPMTTPPSVPALLPSTGSGQAEPMLRIAAGLLLAGAVLVLAVRRRKVA